MTVEHEVVVKSYLLEQFGLDGVRVVQRDPPTCAPGQALVKVHACSLNYRDLAVATGKYNPKLRLPVVPLSDGAGEVVAVGEGVTRVRVGDRVAANFMQGWLDGGLSYAHSKTALGADRDGMLAEYVALPQDGWVHLPAHLTYEEGATLPCAAVTAWNAVVEEGRLRPGESVLILGSGGVSLFALAFARMQGARVIALSGSDEKMDLLRRLGAASVINYQTTPQWAEPVRQASGGGGVDLVVEVGGAGTLARSLSAVRHGGTICMMGSVVAGNGFNHLPIVMKSVRLQGILVGSRAMFERMNRALEVHAVHPTVGQRFRFEQAAEALRLMESGSHVGKIVVTVAA